MLEPLFQKRWCTCGCRIQRWDRADFSNRLLRDGDEAASSWWRGGHCYPVLCNWWEERQQSSPCFVSMLLLYLGLFICPNTPQQDNCRSCLYTELSGPQPGHQQQVSTTSHADAASLIHTTRSMFRHLFIFFYVGVFRIFAWGWVTQNVFDDPFHLS